MSIKESVKSVTQLLGCILWLAIGLIQFFAVYSLISNFIIALILAEIPIVGSIIAVYAACIIWHWNVWLCILLFCPLYIITLVAFICDFIEDRLKKNQHQKKYKEHMMNSRNN